MLLDFAGMQAQIRHPGERGRERESALKQFLSEYLPSRYSIAKGEIVDSQGSVSRECDLVIYDATKCPLLLSGDDYRVFPVEPVLGVIEVKSRLDESELRDAVEKVACAKRLYRKSGPVLGVVFAYTSSYRQDPMQKTARCLQRLNREVGPVEYLDLLCILDAGVILTYADCYPRIAADPESLRTMLIHFDFEMPVLLYFFTRLMTFLDAQEPASPIYENYLAEDETGISTVFHADPRSA